MAPETFHVITRIVAKPESEPAIQLLLSEVVEPTRQEPGCLHYELLQSPVNAAEFILYGIWQTETAFEKHMDSAHVQQAFIEGGRQIKTPPEIRRYHRLA